MLEAIRSRINAEAFFELPETTQSIHLIDGEIIDMGTPTPAHQDIVLSLGILLRPRAKALGGRVFVAPLEVYLDEYNVPQPDIAVILPNSRCEVTPKRLVGAPDVVVEVLSPGSVRMDRKIKFELYERHGVREYWLVDPAEALIEVSVMHDARLQRHGVYGNDETFTSPLLGEIDGSAIFAS
jgi:Uma2 family endonuclease